MALQLRGPQRCRQWIDGATVACIIAAPSTEYRAGSDDSSVIVSLWREGPVLGSWCDGRREQTVVRTALDGDWNCR